MPGVNVAGYAMPANHPDTIAFEQMLALPLTPVCSPLQWIACGTAHVKGLDEADVELKVQFQTDQGWSNHYLMLTGRGTGQVFLTTASEPLPVTTSPMPMPITGFRVVIVNGTTETTPGDYFSITVLELDPPS